jgi:hypothetical protein
VSGNRERGPLDSVDFVEDVINRGRMTRRTRRYPSDTSDQQWAVIEPLLPPVNTGAGNTRLRFSPARHGQEVRAALTGGADPSSRR